MPVSWAMRDMVTESGPSAATSRAVVATTASCTSRRCASIVSFHSFGIGSLYATTMEQQSVLTATKCIDKQSLVIEVRGLTKVFGDQPAVDDLTFSAPAGKVTGFLGPNGAGKTTTFRCMLGLAEP